MGSSLTPGSSLAGDFTGDGRLDLVLVEVADGITMWVGNGDGTFQAPRELSLGNQVPYTLVAGDFNGDGRPDLAAANYGSDAILVLLNKGDGTFAVPQPASAGDYPLSGVSADFNGDGRLDLAVTSFGGISVLLGDGDGTFQPQLTYAIPGGDPGGWGDSGIVAGDFNGDGRTDLATADGNGFVSVLLGNGDGTFQPATEYAAGYFPGAIVAGDFNGDGRLDLAVTDQGNIYGTVTEPASASCWATATAPSSPRRNTRPGTTRNLCCRVILTVTAGSTWPSRDWTV